MRNYEVSKDSRYIELPHKEKVYIRHLVRKFKKRVETKTLREKDINVWAMLVERYGIKKLNVKVSLGKKIGQNIKIFEYEV